MDVKDPKNIPSLFREMEDQELPKGFDERFSKKLDQENRSWIGRFSFFNLPNLGWVVGAASIFAVSLKLNRSKNQNQSNDFAVDDEIDMLENLDTLNDWDDSEDHK